MKIVLFSDLCRSTDGRMSPREVLCHGRSKGFVPFDNKAGIAGALEELQRMTPLPRPVLVVTATGQVWVDKDGKPQDGAWGRYWTGLHDAAFAA